MARHLTMTGQNPLGIVLPSQLSVSATQLVKSLGESRIKRDRFFVQPGCLLDVALQTLDLTEIVEGLTRPRLQSRGSAQRVNCDLSPILRSVVVHLLNQCRAIVILGWEASRVPPGKLAEFGCRLRRRATS